MNFGFVFRLELSLIFCFYLHELIGGDRHRVTFCAYRGSLIIRHIENARLIYVSLDATSGRGLGNERENEGFNILKSLPCTAFEMRLLPLFLPSNADFSGVEHRPYCVDFGTTLFEEF